MTTAPSKVDVLKQGLRTGEVLICDFDTGFKPPEMVKRRPVAVVSRTATHWRGLCTVVPLSTTDPKPQMSWHVLMLSNPLHGHLPESHAFGKPDIVWAKCDMLYTVGFERVTRIHRRVNGRRDYQGVRVGKRDLDDIIKAVHTYLPAVV